MSRNWRRRASRSPPLRRCSDANSPIDSLRGLAPRENSIDARGLVREFKKGPRAVDGIDLHVDPGEIYGFLGPNGAGKSTTVHMLTTLLPPTAGTATVGGYDVVENGPEVRKTIGAALQEAALDPYLTGREHLRLQTTMHGITGEERKRRSDELLARVGLTEAADRKIRGYSGGMKRRLDLALALVHRPRILFLDEPTTGLDIQSRTALWEEVGRLAKEEGVTVFLTTQYLEEADVLADRVGIIDHGHIVAEGTPEQLKAEIARSTVEAIPAEAEQSGALAVVLERFGTPTTGFGPGSVAVQLAASDGDIAQIVRALDGEGVRIAHLQIHEPTLDDVFLAKTGRHLEGAGDEDEQAGAGGNLMHIALLQAATLGRRAVVRTARQPANVVFPLIFPMLLLAVNAGGLKAETNLPGFPTDSFLAFALAVPFVQGALLATVNANVEFARDIQTGFLNRLALTPVRGFVLLVGQLGGLLTIALVQAVFYLVVGVAFGVRLETGLRRRSRPARARSGDRARIRIVRQLGGAADRVDRGGAGALSRLLRLPVSLVDEHSAQLHRNRLVPLGGDDQSCLVPDRGGALARDRGLELGDDRPRLRRRDRHVPGRLHARLARTDQSHGAHVRDAWNVARGVWWRQAHLFFTNPSFLLPSLLFPLFFFTAFVGGLSRITQVPGFDFPLGYTAFQFVFVLLQSAAFAGVFTGFGIARDWETGFMRRLMLAAPNRTGILLGYMGAALTRWFTVIAVVTGSRVRRPDADWRQWGRSLRPVRRSACSSASRAPCGPPAWRCGCARSRRFP